MSKPLPSDQPLPRREPAEQLGYFADRYRGRVQPLRLEQLQARMHVLGVDFTPDELTVLAALDAPDKVQEFLNTEIYYNNDHASPDLEETAMSPRRVLETGLAHCFEGALFAYAVNFLHGHSPQLMLLEASQDSEHNLVLFQDSRTRLYGCNAHSAFRNLDGRPANYSTLRALAESYFPYYYSDRSMDPNDLTLVGYSDPFDLISRYGVAWIASREPLWDIYCTYVDDTVHFHYLSSNSDETHSYPLVTALKQKWIELDSQGRPFVNADHLPVAAQNLWREFWNTLDARDERPRGRARELEQEFFRLTGTTPIDLNDNVEELDTFLERGYRIEQLLTQYSRNKK